MNLFPGDLPQPAEYDAVLFDFDGTLVETASNHAKAWANAVGKLTGKGCPWTAADFRARWAGVSSSEVARVLALESQISPHELLAASTAAKMEIFSDWECVEPVVTFAGSSRSLGKKMAIVTGGDKQVIEHILPQKSDLMRIFSGVPIFDPSSVRAGRGKPCPDMFLLAAVRLGVDPSRCIVLEDADIGIQAAHRAGMKGFLVGATATKE